MKLTFLSVETGREVWFEEALRLYSKKLSALAEMEWVVIQSSRHQRREKNQKVSFESQKILKKISPSDFLVLFDEQGKSFENSRALANNIQVVLLSGKSKIIFLLGGAFGVAEEIKQRANLVLSLSRLTFNHRVAAVVALEQIYRAFTILRNIPYHNE